MTDLTIRPLQDAERGPLLTLNNAAVPHVNELDPATLDAVLGHAALVLAALAEDRLVGGLVALPPGADYASANYRWFDERFGNFLYVDRVMVDRARRGTGVGRRLYEALADLAPADCDRILCEVNESPPNPESMAFHDKLGFRAVASRVNPDSGNRVRMLALELKEASG